MIQLLRVAEVAEILRLQPWAVYQMIRDGRLDAVRIGRTVRVSPAALSRLTRGAIRDVSVVADPSGDAAA
jgi:excisionase family DNA binding protein